MTSNGDKTVFIYNILTNLFICYYRVSLSTLNVTSRTITKVFFLFSRTQVNSSTYLELHSKYALNNFQFHGA